MSILEHPSLDTLAPADLGLLMDNLPLGVALYDFSSQICLYANKAYAKTYLTRPEQLIGKPLPLIVGKEAMDIAKPYSDEFYKTRAPVQYLHRASTSPDARTAQVMFVPKLNAEGKIERFFIFLKDITRERQAEAKLLENEQRLSAFMSAGEEGIVIHHEGVILDVNPALCRLVGYSYEQLVGTPILNYVAPQCRANVSAHIARNSTDIYDGIIVNRDGSEVAVEQMGRSICFKGQSMRMTILRDTRVRIASEQRIHYLAHYDELTGLPNRSYFMTLLGDALTSQQGSEQAAALLFIDIDKFKRINDSLGHAAGDEVLKVASKRLQSVVGVDDIVARFAGDEFVVLLRKAPSHAAVQLAAERITRELKIPVRITSHEVPLSAATGIALFPEHAVSPKELIAHADQAVLAAKRRGAGTVQFYTSAMTDAAYQAIVMEQELHQALARDEFEVYYQPQISSKDDALIGLEALIRWHHPRHGLMQPGQFLPLAEDRRLMENIGDWVLDAVVRTLCKWRSEGLKLVPVSVNLSSQQFESREFAPKLAALLKQHDLPSQYLELELTERMLMEDVALVREQLAHLRRMGVRVSVDDFGTGFSSLAHLKQYDVDRLKIDQSFVRDLPDAQDSVAISRAIVQMAHTLGIAVMAEGVESQVQRKFLTELGCDAQQGFLFGKAVPESETSILLRR